jgi:hypothetical protein
MKGWRALQLLMTESMKQILKTADDFAERWPAQAGGLNSPVSSATDRTQRAWYVTY